MLPVASSIYYALGIVAVVAMGATPIALGIAGILFIERGFSHRYLGGGIPYF